jgi:hypothetical protein
VASVAGENASAAAAAGYDAAAAAGDQVAESWDAVVSKVSLQVYGAPTPTPWYASMYSAVGEYASSATSAAGEGGASVTSAAGVYSDEIAQQYSAASSIVSGALVGKEPSFSESVISRLSAAYATGASAASEAGGAVKSVGDKAASAASEATEAVKDTASSIRDEL